MAATAAVQPTSVHSAESVLFFVLLQLTIITFAGRLGGVLGQRFRQAAVTGEIVIGILLGPSFFGYLFPGVFDYVFGSTPPQSMYVLSQIGLILLMFSIGMEFDFSQLRAKINRDLVTRIALASLVVPFVLGLTIGYCSAGTLSPGTDPLLSGLFVATAFSITALPVLGRIMIECNMSNHPLGVVAISAAAINDLVGWLLLALVTAITLAQFDAWKFLMRVGALALFGAVCWMGVRPFLKWAVGRFGDGNRNGAQLTDNLLAILVVTVFVAAMCTYQLGVFAILGAFIVGALLHDETILLEAWKQRVGRFVNIFFLPIFFTYTGLRTQIGGLDSLTLWAWCLLFLVLATLGKFGATYLAARSSGLGESESSVLGVMMNTRGLVELIVLNIGLDLAVISRHVFTMLVIMAIISTLITAPVLHRYMSRVSEIRA
jgi:Kef-type K+ transport system membrane component KefB